MASFRSSYLQDIEDIDRISGKIGGYRSRLEQICSADISPTNLRSAEILVLAYNEMEDALSLGRRYSAFGCEGIRGPGERQVSELVSLWEMFSDKADGYAESLFMGWAIGAEVIEKAGKKAGHEMLGEAKEELAMLAENYLKVSGYVGAGIREKNSCSIILMDEYRGFMKERRSLDERLERLAMQVDLIIDGEFVRSGRVGREGRVGRDDSFEKGGRVSGEESSHAGRIVYAESELSGLAKAYSSLARQHSGLRGRLMGKRYLFDCAEQLSELERMRCAIRKRMSGRGYEGAEDYEKLLDLWIGVYRNFLKRIDGANEITPEYVDELCGTELAEGQFLAGAMRNPALAKKIGGFAELDSAVRGKLEEELSRVERELERRGQLYEEELGEPDYREGCGQKDNLELMLAAAYELSRMSKRCGLGNEKAESIREEVERRLMVSGADERLEEKRNLARAPYLDLIPGGIPVGIPVGIPGGIHEEMHPDIKGRYRRVLGADRAADKVEDLTRGLIDEMSDKLREIVRNRQELGVLGIGEIDKILEAKDSCYLSIREAGGEIPCDEIEGMVRDIYEADREKINRFVRQNANRPIDEDALRQAARYRDVLGEWEKVLKG